MLTRPSRARRSRRRRRRKAGIFSALAGGAIAYAGASWLAAEALSGRLISAKGLGPTTQRREDLLDALRRIGASVADFRHTGSARSPVRLAALFAAPAGGRSRATILFLHGKGGSSAEWEPDALRALQLGYALLIPDLRGHPPSEGEDFTYGFLEKEDLVNALSTARERFGIDPARLGIHGCSAGSTVALEFAGAGHPVRALWLESPYADHLQMARHYLSLATGLPSALLGLTTRWAVRRAAERVRRHLGIAGGEGSLEQVDPVRAAARVRAAVCLVSGARDRLVPPRFARRLADALPPGTIFWSPAAGHCHHEDEPARVVAEDYERRWIGFFSRHLPA